MTVSDSPPKRKKRPEMKGSAGRKQLLCPRCHHRVIDQRENGSSELHIMEENDPWEADYYLKCQWCKSEIGLRKTG